MFAEILDNYHLVPNLLSPLWFVCTPWSREANDSTTFATAMVDDDTNVE